MNDNNLPLPDQHRRNFLKKSAMAGSFTALTPFFIHQPLSAKESKSWTVGEVMDLFISKIQDGPFPETVDTLKAGNRRQKVTGIVTTMFAHMQVIEKAIDLGANFIIAHEPTFYNHLDETNWLKEDPVFQDKMALLKKHQIAVWRNHDYIHSYKPDGVMEGVAKKLEWKQYQQQEPHTYLLSEAMSMSQIVSHVKKQMGIKMVRTIGNMDQSCQKILLMPGAAGGKRQISLASEIQPDMVICGEVSEWETAEYIRDAYEQGKKISLVVLGHIDSEEPGSDFMADWLQKNIPDITTTHIPATNPFSFH